MALFARLFGPRVKHIGPRKAHELHASGAALIDVRKRREVRDGTPRGARHVPLHTLDHRADSFDPKVPVVCICRSGRRSNAAAKALLRAGVEEVYSVRGGFSAWQRNDLPVDR